MQNDQPRARVFISCGQSKESDEVQIAREISNRLREVGFDPYVAVAEQTLRGLKENIFEQLRSSEYFVFVDFKREALNIGQSEVHRGSLFSHQELAIASFLNLDVVAFQEFGIKRNDGLIQFLQTNAIEFKDRSTLPFVVADIIRQRGWDPAWKNELVLHREPQEYSDAEIIIRPGLHAPGRLFHIDVQNLHNRKFATNCYAYLEKVVKRPDGNIPFKTAEFKWAGVQFPNVGIAPGSTRAFDAFYILRSNPTRVLFNVFTDSTDFIPNIPEGAAEYELTYLAIAENFPPTRSTFSLNIKTEIDQTTLRAQHC